MLKLLLNRLKVPTLLVALSLLPGYLQAQNPEIDSLQRLLQTHPQLDKERVKMLVGLASRLNGVQPQAAAAAARQALRGATTLRYDGGQAAAYTELAVCAYERGNLDSAAVFFSSALTIYKAQKGEAAQKVLPGIIRVQNGLASVYAARGQYHEGLKLFVANLQIAESISDKRMQLRSLANMGALAEQMLDTARALRYYRQSLSLADSVENGHEYETSLCNIAGLYLNEKQYDKAAPYITRALQLNKQSGDAQNQGTLQLYLGQVEMAKARTAQARTHFQQALQLGRQVGDNYLIGRSLLLLGQVAGREQQHVAAVQYYQQALPLVLEIGIFDNIRDAYSGLAAAYSAQGKFTEAFRSQQKQIAFGDSAIKDKALSEARLLQTRFDTERKEAQNRLQAAQLRTQQQIIRRRNVQLIAGLVIAALLLGLGYSLYTRRRLRREVEFAQERQQLERLRSQAVLEAEEAERRRIGSDLHDGVGQLLTAAKLNLHALGEQLNIQTEGQQTMLQNALDVVDESFREVRTISHNLMPNALIKRGLAQAVRDFLSKISPDDRLKIQLEVVGLDRGGRLDATVENVLFRVIQELAQNIVKHAQATQMTLQIIRSEEELTIMVEDNGVGFDPAALGEEAGIGLKNIESRMAYLGGRAEFDSSPGRGTTVTLEVPLTPQTVAS